MEATFDAAFFASLLKIMGINLVLAGDNAVVIALAARSLAPDLQRKAIIFGTVAAVVLRIILTAGVAVLLDIPFLSLIGGLLLLWIGYKLATDDNSEHHVGEASGLRQAVMTILIADLVMSLDNALAIAAAADGDYLLIALGLLISIPIVMGGANLLLALIGRFPIIVWIGAALVIYTGVELSIGDPTIHDTAFVEEAGHTLLRLLGLAITAVIIGVAWLRVRGRGSDANAPLMVEGLPADE